MQRVADFKISDSGDFEVKLSYTEDNTELHRANAQLKQCSHNGFTKNRTMRHLANVPITAYRQAVEQGVDFRNKKELYGWLKQHPEYLTVDAILTNKQLPNVIIK